MTFMQTIILINLMIIIIGIFKIIYDIIKWIINKFNTITQHEPSKNSYLYQAENQHIDIAKKIKIQKNSLEHEGEDKNELQINDNYEPSPEELNLLSDDEFLEYIESDKFPLRYRNISNNAQNKKDDDEHVEINDKFINPEITFSESNDNNNNLNSNQSILIKNIINSRNIDYLFHFTKESNVISIIQNGLWPRNILDKNNKNYDYNDEISLDNRINTISLSIGFPNHKMFYKYRMQESNKFVNWCVIGIDKSVLYKKECLFCFMNAATNNIRNLNQDELTGSKALEFMFEFDKDNRNGLPPNIPTDTQAEVLVMDIIEPRYINFIHFDNYLSLEKYQILNSIKIEFNKKYFNSREYYLSNLSEISRRKAWLKG